MQSSNISIVFGPTLMRAETDSVEMAALMPLQNGIVELMISEYDRIFLKWPLTLCLSVDLSFFCLWDWKWRYIVYAVSVC